MMRSLSISPATISMLLAVFLAMIAAGESLLAAPPTPRDPFYLGGIQVNEADHNAWFDALEAEGMNTVEVTAYARQGDWDSDNLFWDAESPWVLAEIRGAKKRGLKVVFIARVALDHAFPRNAFLWHGMIQPKNDALLDAWFERYRRFVLGWAKICEAEGVDVFAVGSEMNALASTLPAPVLPPLEEYYLDEKKQQERRQRLLAHRESIGDRFPGELDARIETEKGWAEQVTEGQSLAAIATRRQKLDTHWRRLIAEVRQVYRGKLTYAANFDQYHQVGFWDVLDFMGINAYFKLRSEIPGPGEKDRLYPLLVAGWRGVLGDLELFRRQQKLEKKPVLFTEMGFTRRALSTLEPWSDVGFSLIPDPKNKGKERLIVWRDQPEDKEERALAVRALHQAHSELPQGFLRGILYWKLSSHDYHEKVESFLVVIGSPKSDPILPELRRFLR